MDVTLKRTTQKTDFLILKFKASRMFFWFIACLFCFNSVFASDDFMCFSTCKDEMAKNFIFLMQECYGDKKQCSLELYKTPNTKDSNTTNTPKQVSKFMCPFCGSKYADLSGIHHPNCICPYCGGQNGYHLCCEATDWEGMEKHDFTKVIELTSLSISNTPNNKDAYFNRSVANFELGNFDEALSDYYSSDEGALQPKSTHKASKAFSSALLRGIINGCEEAAVEFIPSLCSTTYGMGTTLWTCVQHPIDSFVNVANSCCEISQDVFDYCLNFDLDMLEEHSEQIKSIAKQFNQLSESERGELIGYTLGKYGVEFLSGAVLGSATYKGYKIVRDIKNANRVCNLEAMAVSAKSKQKITLAAKEHAIARQLYFEKVKYNFNSHFKHVKDHPYYDGKRSVWLHPDPEGLLKRFAGKGQPKSVQSGVPGYKESVDFGEYIGIWKENKIDGRSLPTTRGIIHYGKNGAHIVPARPSLIIGE